MLVRDEIKRYAASERLVLAVLEWLIVYGFKMPVTLLDRDACILLGYACSFFDAKSKKT